MQIEENLIDILCNCNYVVVLTGAGVSAESGIKTFRDPDGLWAKFNPTELASIEGFMANPQRVWEWYRYRREIVYRAQPNSGHYSIAKMEKLFSQFTLITQNVDRLHQKAGSTNVIELHGNIIENHCFDCGTPYVGETDLENNEIPRCRACGGLVRPSVVWFGELLPADALKLAEESSEECDVFFSVGTSAEVYPAANLPLIAKYAGATVVEVNPNPTALSYYADFKLQAPSGEALPILVSKIIERKGGKI